MTLIKYKFKIETMSKTIQSTLISAAVVSVGLCINNGYIDISDLYKKASKFTSIRYVHLKNALLKARKHTRHLIKSKQDSKQELENQLNEIIKTFEESQEKVEKKIKKIVSRNAERDGKLSKTEVNVTFNQISRIKDRFRTAATKNDEACLKMVKVLQIVPIFGDALKGVEMILDGYVQQRNVLEQCTGCAKMIFQLIKRLDEELEEYEKHGLQLNFWETKEIKKLLNKMIEGLNIVNEIENKKWYYGYLSVSTDKKTLEKWKQEVVYLLEEKKDSLTHKIYVHVRRSLKDIEFIKRIHYASLIIGAVTLLFVVKIYIIITQKPKIVLIFSQMTNATKKLLTNQFSAYRQFILKKYQILMASRK